MKNRKAYLLLALLFGLTVAGYGAAYLWHTPSDLGYDEKAYLGLADLWAHGKADRVAHRPPLIWVGLGLVERAGLDPYATAVVINGLCLGAVVVVTVALGMRLWRWYAGLAVAGLLLGHPWLRQWWFPVMPEMPTLALTLGATLALVSRRHWVAGILLGAAALARPEVLGVVPLFAMAAYLRSRKRRDALAVVVGGVIAVLPWTVRNAITVHRFVPIASSTAANIWFGSNFGPRWPGIEQATRTDAREMRHLLPTLRSGGIAPYDFPMRTALKAFARHLDLLPAKALHLWYGVDYYGHDITPRGTALALTLWGAAGIALGLRRGRPLAVLALCWMAWYTAMAMLMFPMDRLQLAALPAFVLGALLIGGGRREHAAAEA